MYRHTFYRKGKVALDVQVDNRGVILRFAPPRDETKFNWDAAVPFALSVDECGELYHCLSHGLEFRAYHQPPGREIEDAKVLSCQPSRGQKSGFSLSLFFPNSKKNKEGFSIFLTPGEAHVICVLLDEGIRMGSQRQQNRRNGPRGGISPSQNENEPDENPF